MIFSKLNPRLVLASPGTFKLLNQTSLLVKRQPQEFKYLVAHNSTNSSSEQQSFQYWNLKHFALLVAAAAASATLFSVANLATRNELLAKEEGQQQQKEEPSERGKEKLLVITPRQKLFFQFASVEYEGMPYMTPQDFLESVTEDHPRRRITTLCLWLFYYLINGL